MTKINKISQSQLEPSQDSQKRRINILASLWGHKFLSFAIFLLLIGIGTTFIISLPPVYFSEAILEVLPNYVGNLKQDRELDFSRSHTFVTTQVHAIKTYDVLLNAAIRLKNENRPGAPITAEDHLRAERLQRFIKVEQIPGTYRLSVSFRDTQPEGLDDTVNAVVEAYQEMMVKNKFVGKDLRIKNLSERKIELQTELRALMARKDRLAEQLGALPVNDQFENPYDRILLKTMESHAEAQRNRLNVENSLATIKYRIESLDELEPPTVSREMLDKDVYYKALSKYLNDRLTVLKTKIARLPAAHPGRSAIEKDITAIEDQLAMEMRTVKERLSEDLLRDQKTKYELEVTNLNEKLAEARFLEDRLATEMKEHKKELTKFSSLYDEFSNLQNRITRIRNQLAAIEDRLDFFELEENAPGFVHIVSLARYPDTPEEGKTIKLLIVLILASIFLSALAAVALDYFNPWIKSPSDIESVLHYPSLGWIPECNSERLVAPTTDQKRRLALAIKSQYTEIGKRCFSLTSVKSGGGTTKLTLELAQQLTELGAKTLAVETNAFRPNSLFTNNGNEKTGLVSILNKKHSLDDVILPKTDSFPARLPIGDTQGKRYLWFDGELFSLLKKTDYDIILFDAPPILLSSDAELLSRHVDATLLVVEAEAVTKGEVQKATKLLDQISTSSFAVIVNRVRVKAGLSYFPKQVKENGNYTSKHILQKSKEPHSKSNGSSVTTYFRMVINDEYDKPYAFKDYQLTVDGMNYFGKTNINGLVENIIPATSKKGTLRLTQNKNGGIHHINEAVWSFTLQTPEKSKNGQVLCHS